MSKKIKTAADIDPAKVKHFASLGLSVEDVAIGLGTTRQTIYNNFKADFDEGRLALKNRIRVKQLDIMENSGPQQQAVMAIHLGKVMCEDLKESTVVEAESEQGDISFSVRVITTKKDAEDLGDAQE